MKCNISESNGHSKHLETKLFEAEEVIEKCLSQCHSNEVFMSFNGGKDCTVLLHILDKVFKRKFGSEASPLLCLYVRPDDPFQEIEDFVQECKSYYNINLVTSNMSLKMALQDIIDKNPNLKAAFMGSRRTDPHCENWKNIQMTDPGWPKILRVSPLLNWSLADIWNYITKHKIPYCMLYDQGYTSIGSKSNTVPNPHLKYITDEGLVKYRPAYFLKEFDQLERAGRL